MFKNVTIMYLLNTFLASFTLKSIIIIIIIIYGIVYRKDIARLATDK